jgi:hypothetical protein
VPVLSHVCAASPLHLVAPGEHVPEHVPDPVHRYGQVIAVTQFPVASQV